MIWGAITARGVGPLVIVDNTLDADGYKKILKAQAIPFCLDLEKNYGEDIIFQQDNAPCHRAKSVEKFIEECGLKTTEWPARSADISPIERIWSVVKSRLSKLDQKPSNLEELKQKIHEIWNSIEPEICNRVVFLQFLRSWPRLLKKRLVHKVM